jgi:hypothetical protein
MSDNGNWSDDSDRGTPLPPKLATAARELSDNMMETVADFDVTSSIFGEHSSSKAMKGKGNMARASWAPATSTSATSRGTTPLSYVSLSPLSVASQGSLTPRSTPAPVVWSLPQKALLEHIHNAVGTFKSGCNDPQTMQFFGQFADKVLQFVLQVLMTPGLKDHPFQGVGGISSFEVQLAQVIASSGPPPPTPATAPPPVPAAMRPHPSDVETAVTPQKPKRAKVLHPAPPPITATSSKRAPAKAMEAPRRAGKSSAPGASSKPTAPPAPVPPSKSSRRRRHRKGRHTVHGLSHRGIKLSPPAGSSIRADAITLDMLQESNKHLKDDIQSDLVLESTFDVKEGIFVNASTVPTAAETACALKHIRRLVTVPGILPIQSATPTATSYLKVLDVPHIPAAPKEWQLAQRTAFQAALRSSPVGSSLDRFIKHTPRFMCTSPHADTCVAWLDITDTVLGSNARAYIGKQVVIGNCNCQIRGAAPRPGSVMCTCCMQWGHHSSGCRAKGIRCPLCGGPHSELSHQNFAVLEKKNPEDRHCVNCSAAKKNKTNHSATDTLCPFWSNRFDCAWLQRQFAP